MTSSLQTCDNYNPYPLDYPLLDELIRYCNDSLDDNIPACQKHKWACQRFLNDLERQGTDDFPYIFVPEKALLFLNWMMLFRHRKGPLAGKRKIPEPIEKFVFGNIYGWVHRDTIYRRFRQAYWQVGRKNAKSQDLAIVGLYELAAFGENASEVYIAASKRDQTRYVWEEADAIYRACPELKGKLKTAYGIIEHPKSGSKFYRMSKDDRKSGDGSNPQCGILDEYHAHETDEYYNLITSGMKTRTQPLLIIITTAGFELNNPCYVDEYDYISKILNPNIPIENDRYFAMVNELDKDEEGNLIDDITDESIWPKANPILTLTDEGVEAIRAELKVAQDKPEKMRDFLTKTMNVWVNMSEIGYMNMDKWAACEGDLPDLTGAECYVGVDLSSSIDLTSVAFEFPLGDDCYAVFSHSFMPEEKFREKINTDKVPYDLWRQQGYITVTPGAVVDYNFVKKYITDKLEENGWRCVEACFDPWHAAHLMQEFMNDGFTAVEIRQGYRTLAAPTKDLRELVYQKKLIHDGNPVLTWAMSNAVARMDHNENIMLDKKKSRERIDPAAALINAHVRAMTLENDNVDVEQYTEDDFLAKLWG